jgi:hypothetical protein
MSLKYSIIFSNLRISQLIKVAFSLIFLTEPDNKLSNIITECPFLINSSTK